MLAHPQTLFYTKKASKNVKLFGLIEQTYFLFFCFFWSIKKLIIASNDDFFREVAFFY